MNSQDSCVPEVKRCGLIMSDGDPVGSGTGYPEGPNRLDLRYFETQLSRRSADCSLICLPKTLLPPLLSLSLAPSLRPLPSPMPFQDERRPSAIFFAKPLSSNPSAASPSLSIADAPRYETLAQQNPNRRFHFILSSRAKIFMDK